jgi:hypothetical protein
VSGWWLLVGLTAIVQPSEGGFGGGYFCCEAGGTTVGLAARGGRRVSPRFSLQAELQVARSFDDELRAPRFFQQNNHRDTVVTLLAGYHPAAGGRVRPVFLAGAGLAVARTAAEVQFVIITTDGSQLEPGSSFTRRETRPVLALGADLPLLLSDRVSLVPGVRGRFIFRSDEARFEEGLSRLSLVSGLSLQIAF